MIRLRKSGIDVSGMPRKTTNIFERFQESMKAFTESSSSSDDSNVLKSAFKSPSGSTSDEVPGEGRSRSQQVGDPIDTMQVTAADGEQQGRRRRTKREVLESRSVDIEQVLLLLACSCSLLAATLTHIHSYIYHAMPWVKVKLATENMLLQSRPVGNGDVSSPAEEEVTHCTYCTHCTYFTHWCLSV